MDFFCQKAVACLGDLEVTALMFLGYNNIAVDFPCEFVEFSFPVTESQFGEFSLSMPEFVCYCCCGMDSIHFLERNDYF